MSEELKEGIMTRLKGDVDGAITIFKKIIDNDPREKDAYDLIGDCYIQKGLLNEALDAFKKFYELEPDNVRNHVYIGRTYGRLKDWPAALEWFQKALDLFDATMPAVLPNYKYMRDDLKLKIDFVNEQITQKMSWQTKWWLFNGRDII